MQASPWGCVCQWSHLELGVQNKAVHSWGMVGQQTEEEEKYLKYFYLQHQGQSQVIRDNEGEEIPLNI